MPGKLAGKIALISGGATGMGGASSKLFAAEGGKVGVVDRNEEAGHAVVAEI
jgi:NAD(P)-dependent dehydrogenase (short-subunit alcohol dehydrogenase family)